MPACSSPCKKPSRTPTSKWAKPTPMKANDNFRSVSGGTYASAPATDWLATRVAAISQLLHDDAAAHEVVAGAAVLVTDEQVLPGPVEGVGRLGRLTRNDHEADGGVLNLKPVENVLAVNVEGDRGAGGDANLAGVEVPDPGPHVDFVPARGQFPHPALGDVMLARRRHRQQLVVDARQADAQHGRTEAESDGEDHQHDTGQCDPHSFVSINVHGLTSAAAKWVALPWSTRPASTAPRAAHRRMSIVTYE